MRASVISDRLNGRVVLEMQTHLAMLHFFLISCVTLRTPTGSVVNAKPNIFQPLRHRHISLVQDSMLQHQEGTPHHQIVGTTGTQSYQTFAKDMLLKETTTKWKEMASKV